MTTTTAPAILAALILSPNIKLDISAIESMHAPENTGYATFSCMPFSALVKKSTFIPPSVRPNRRSKYQITLLGLFDIPLYNVYDATLKPMDRNK